MVFALALMLTSFSPRAIAQAAPPSPPPQAAPAPACAVRPRFVAVAVDPTPAIDVNTTQQFIVAMRVVADGGYQWRLVDPAPPPGVRAEGSQILSDVAFQNLDRKPDAPPMLGGEATQLFLFTAMTPGPSTLTFGLFRPGGDAPTRSVAYMVRVSPDVAIC